jgi:hypothetical protein
MILVNWFLTKHLALKSINNQLKTLTIDSNHCSLLKSFRVVHHVATREISCQNETSYMAFKILSLFLMWMHVSERATQPKVNTSHYLSFKYCMWRPTMNTNNNKHFLKWDFRFMLHCVQDASLILIFFFLKKSI